VIDLHCHLLPGVDDGASNLSVSLAMARLAVAQGTTVAGYVPILTHPERLSWVPSRYETLKKLVQMGVWMQVTAGAFTGAFGRDALYWAERLLDEGCVHLIASDAHDAERRPPDMALGREAVAKRIGAQEARHLVSTRPMGILKDQPPSTLPGPGRVADVESVGIPEHWRMRGPSDVGGDAVAGLRGLSGRLRRLFR
jgi:tyrosine-protein phosphatase YwqE